MINPKGYKTPSIGPLHRCQFNEKFFESLLKKYGFKIIKKGNWKFEEKYYICEKIK